MPEPLAFEVSSRGDRVLGRLWLGPARGARPVVLVAPGLGAAKHVPEVVALCEALVEGGLAAAAIDLPLQGERVSTKLSRRLAACAGQRERAGTDRALWEEFLRQAALDLAATADVLALRHGLDAARLACLAFEPGAEAAAAFSARDERVRAFRRVEVGTAPAELVRFVRERLGS